MAKAQGVAGVGCGGVGHATVFAGPEKEEEGNVCEVRNGECDGVGIEGGQGGNVVKERERDGFDALWWWFLVPEPAEEAVEPGIKGSRGAG